MWCCERRQVRGCFDHSPLGRASIAAAEVYVGEGEATQAFDGAGAVEEVRRMKDEGRPMSEIAALVQVSAKTIRRA